MKTDASIELAGPATKPRPAWAGFPLQRPGISAAIGAGSLSSPPIKILAENQENGRSHWEPSREVKERAEQARS
jgi:hypothetical protein